MGNTTTVQVPAEVNNFYDRTLLMRAIPRFVHNRWAQIRDVPVGAGTKTIKFRRYSNLTAATTALTEGITPVGSQLSTTEITATVLQYGDFITVTDVLDYQSQDSVLTEAAEILGDQAGDTLDILSRAVLNAGTSVTRVAARAARINVVAGDIIDTGTIKKVVRSLKNNKARRITKMVNATTGIATEPLNAAYIGICHPNVTYTLKGLTGFIPVEKYSNTSNIMDGEVGKYDEVRFVESTNAKVFEGLGGGGIDVYSTLIFGTDAYANSRIAGKALTNIIKPLGSGGSSDPLNQRATSGWKAEFVTLILNNDFIFRLESAMV